MIPWNLMNLMDNSTGTVRFGREVVPTAVTRDRNGRAQKRLGHAEMTMDRDRALADQITGQFRDRDMRIYRGVKDPGTTGMMSRDDGTRG